MRLSRRACSVVLLVASLWFIQHGLRRARSATLQSGGTGQSTNLTGYPITIRNCGMAMTFLRPPARAIAMDQISTEILLHLGLKRSIVGTAFKTNEIFSTVAQDYKAVPVLAKMYPSKEVLTDASPDFILGNIDFFTYSGFPPGSNFTRRELTDKGIKSYTLVCAGDDNNEERIFERFRELGRIFGVGPRADELIATVKQSLSRTADVLASSHPITVFIYRSGAGPLLTFGGGGEADRGLNLSGGKNVFADKTSLPPPSVSLETVIDRDPAAILISDEDTTPVEEKKRLIRRLLSGTQAVRENHFCVADFYSYGTPFRLARDVNVIGKCLHPDLAFPAFP